MMPARPAADGNAGPTGALQFEGWVFDRLGHRLTTPQGVTLALSNAELRLFSAFVDHPRRVLSRDRLLDLARAPGTEVTDRAIDLAVSRLRQKLGDAGPMIRTVRGEGYVFDADPVAV